MSFKLEKKFRDTKVVGTYYWREIYMPLSDVAGNLEYKIMRVD